MARPKRFTARSRGPQFRHNGQIRISPIRLIDQDENQLGIVPTQDALRMARDADLDLVEVAPNARPPVCRILDYGKWKYQQQKREDKSKSKSSQLKEVKIRTVKIGDHDLEIKVNRARKFLDDGHKVQFTLQYRGREMAHQDLGREILRKIQDTLADASKVEQDMRMQGRRVSMVLAPEKKDPEKLKKQREEEEAERREAEEPVIVKKRTLLPQRKSTEPEVVQTAASVKATPPAADDEPAPEDAEAKEAVSA
ncbi:MAG: translation initiation factor IF-3 [Planctomycetota bacterium]